MKAHLKPQLKADQLQVVQYMMQHRLVQQKQAQRAVDLATS